MHVVSWAVPFGAMLWWYDATMMRNGESANYHYVVFRRKRKENWTRLWNILNNFSLSDMKTTIQRDCWAAFPRSCQKISKGVKPAESTKTAPKQESFVGTGGEETTTTNTNRSSLVPQNLIASKNNDTQTDKRPANCQWFNSPSTIAIKRH